MGRASDGCGADLLVETGYGLRQSLCEGGEHLGGLTHVVVKLYPLLCRAKTCGAMGYGEGVHRQCQSWTCLRLEAR